jgi:uncharacterized Fe-S cluster-containing radical SAM superfamily protein
MELVFPFDPVKRAEVSESLVMKNDKRLYHRFRAAPYYGGIATADAVGCSFLCAYCWNYGRNLNPNHFGTYFSSENVASNLLSIARKKSFHLYRITGSEPILGDTSFKHLLNVLQILFRKDPHSIFILETNGFILGFKKELADHLKFKNIQIRISIKGADPVSFEKITGAKKEFFYYPFIALRELEEKGIKGWPAVTIDFFNDDEIQNLKTILKEYKIKSNLEFESLEDYPFVVENLKRRNITLKRYKHPI